MNHRLAIAALAVALSFPFAGARASDTAAKADLGGRTLLDLTDDRAPLPTGRALAPTFDAALPHAAACDEPAGQIAFLPEDSRAAGNAAEAKRIAGAAGVLERKGKVLTLAPPGGAPLRFTDYEIPETKTADGDGAYHWYAGKLPGSGYWRVEAHYQHDAPGSYLVPPNGKNVVFVHNGGRISALAADGKRVASFEELNAPHLLMIAALETDGARIELACHFHPGTTKARANTCGWTGPSTFELAWNDVPYRFARVGDAWRLTVGAASAPVPVTCVAP